MEVCPLPKSQATSPQRLPRVGPLNGQRRTALVGTQSKTAGAITTFTGFNNQWQAETFVHRLLETKRRHKHRYVDVHKERSADQSVPQTTEHP